MLEKAAGRESERGEAAFLLARSGMDTEDARGQLGGGAGFRKGSEGNFTPTTLAQGFANATLGLFSLQRESSFHTREAYFQSCLTALPQLEGRSERQRLLRLLQL